MNKLSTITRPAALILSLVAAFGAQAQINGDDADRAGYGPTPVPAIAKVASASSSQEIVISAARQTRMAAAFDAADRSGYGPTPVTPSLLTRAEVRAEAIAARQAGYGAIYLQGADLQNLAFARSYK